MCPCTRGAAGLRRATGTDSVHASRRPGDRASVLALAPSRITRSTFYIYCMTVTMYNEGVKTITITIPEDLDERAAAEARRRGISKSELIRQGLGSVLTPAPREPGQDPWHSLAGFGAEDISVRPGEVDDVIYSQ
jgi:Ribbon-helix-helix protein, copG family